MKASDRQSLLREAETFLGGEPSRLPAEGLSDYVGEWFRRGQRMLAALPPGSPLYVFDPEALRERAREFRSAFEGELPETGFFYAMKSNNYPGISRVLHSREGFGLDVSSGLELETALSCGEGEIVFSGPGKTVSELALALENRDRVTVLLDSFGEAGRLSKLAAGRGVGIRAGVRITPPFGSWNKFGVALSRLREFWEEGEKLPGLELNGLQFHTSWNRDPSAQVATLAAIGECLASWPRRLREKLAFLDLGGGFWPPGGEWLQYAATPRGLLETALGGEFLGGLEHYYLPAQRIEVFARVLGKALREHIFPGGACRVCFEPGRWVCNDAMHLLITVIDAKDGLVITDAGTNTVGWERYESDYSPVLNLTRPELRERECRVLGSLCTPHDLWGYSYWGAGIEPGDVLLIPCQGAYTYSLRQNFIKPLPEVAVWNGSGPDS